MLSPSWQQTSPLAGDRARSGLELHISKREDGTMGCMSEGMSKEWCRRALYAAVDALLEDAKFD